MAGKRPRCPLALSPIHQSLSYLKKSVVIDEHDQLVINSPQHIRSIKALLFANLHVVGGEKAKLAMALAEPPAFVNLDDMEKNETKVKHLQAQAQT